MAGDINARTAELRDFTEMDSFLADYFDFESEALEFFDQQVKLRLAGIYLYSLNQRTKKITMDLGYWKSAKNNNLFMANGRIGKDKNIDNLPFCNTSLLIIRYAL